MNALPVDKVLRSSRSEEPRREIVHERRSVSATSDLAVSDRGPHTERLCVTESRAGRRIGTPLLGPRGLQGRQARKADLSLAPSPALQRSGFPARDTKTRANDGRLRDPHRIASKFINPFSKHWSEDL